MKSNNSYMNYRKVKLLECDKNLYYLIKQYTKKRKIYYS